MRPATVLATSVLSMLSLAAACQTPVSEKVRVGVDSQEAYAASGGSSGAAENGSYPAPADDVPTLRKGLMIGTWKPTSGAAFDQAFIDEDGLREAFTGWSAGRRQWRGFAAESGEVPLDALFGQPRGPEIGYVYSLLGRQAQDGVFADAEALLHIEHRGRISVRVDGRLVLQAPPTTGPGSASHIVPIILTGPYDVLLAKVGRGSSELGSSFNLSIRVTDVDGKSIPGQAWTTMRPAGLPSDL